MATGMQFLVLGRHITSVFGGNDPICFVKKFK